MRIEYTITVLVLALGGLSGFSHFGEASQKAISGDTQGTALHQPSMAVSQQAGTLEAVAHISEKVGGMGNAVREVWEVVGAPLKDPDLFARVGIEAPNGVILHGPPGTGKTMLARAAAQEVGATFFQLNGADSNSKYFGESGENLRNLFEEAKAQAPSVIFVDEIDALTPKREGMTGNSAGFYGETVGQFLTLVSDLKPEDRVRVVAATNRIDALDEAVRRPGRFDREIYIGPPSQEGLLDILRITTRNMVLAPNVSLPSIAERIRGFVGADVAALVREAGMEVVRRLIDSGEETSKVGKATWELDPARLEAAFPKVVEGTVSAEGKLRFYIPDGVEHGLDYEAMDSFLSYLEARGERFPTKSTTEPPPPPEGVALAGPPMPAFMTMVVPTEVLQTRANQWLELVENSEPELYEELSRQFAVKRQADTPVAKKDFEAALTRVKPSATREGSVVVSNVKWSDIGGYDAVKEELRDRIELPLQHPELFQRLGAKAAPDSVLLVGDPGTGKTLFVKALANEINANMFALKGSELRDGHIGESAKRIQAVFDRARRTKPAIIFIDEIDSLLPVRGTRSGEDDAIINAFLTEMQGLENSDGVIVVGTTNRPDQMDPALLRSGRFGEPITVPLPDDAAREAIFGVHLRGLKLGKGVDNAALAAKTKGLSGADIEEVVTQAVRITIKDFPTRKSIPAAAFDKAVERVNKAKHEADVRAGKATRKIGF